MIKLLVINNLTSKKSSKVIKLKSAKSPLQNTKSKTSKKSRRYAKKFKNHEKGQVQKKVKGRVQKRKEILKPLNHSILISFYVKKRATCFKTGRNYYKERTRLTAQTRLFGNPCLYRRNPSSSATACEKSGRRHRAKVARLRRGHRRCHPGSTAGRNRTPAAVCTLQFLQTCLQWITLTTERREVGGIPTGKFKKNICVV